VSSSNGTDGQSSGSNNRAGEDQNESLLARIILTPVIFTSFLLSLLVVNRRYRAWRVSEHPPASTSFWSRISLRNWLDPEPYQSPADSTWRRAQDSNEHVSQSQREKWFTQKKHRKIARLEIGDAFDLSKKVMVFVGSIFVVGALGVAWAAKEAFHAILW